MSETKKRVLFIEPPPRDPSRIPERFAGCTYMLYPLPDLGQLYLMSFLEREGHTVDIMNAVLDRLSTERFLEKVTAWSPDVLILHSVILAKRTDTAILPKLAQAAPNAQILVHGPEPTRVPEEYLNAVQDKEARERVIVFRGEPEIHIRDYLANGERTGASFVRDGEIVHTQHSEEFLDLDDLPFTHHGHPSMERYKTAYFNPKFSGRPVATMLASRGCRWRCAYCVPNSVSFARELEYRKCHPGEKPPALYASAGHVIEEFREISSAGFKAVMVMDDQFLAQRSRTLEICEGIAPLGLEWGCLSRPDYLTNEEVVSALADSGCVSVDIGVESFCQPVLDTIQKDLKLETVYKCVPLMQRYRVEPKVNIMFGTCAIEREEDIHHTVDELRRLDLHHVMFSIATPFKGTPFYEQSERDGYLVDDSDEINPFSKSMVSYPHLSRERLNQLTNEAYRRFYLRPSQIWRRLRNTRSLKSLLTDAWLALRLMVRR